MTSAERRPTDDRSPRHPDRARPLPALLTGGGFVSGCQTCGGYGNRHDPVAHDTRRCVRCGNAAVNLWKSWNVTAEWTCDECAPDGFALDEEW